MKHKKPIHKDRDMIKRKTTLVENINEVDVKIFCAAAACESWSVFKQRQSLPKRFLQQAQSQQLPSTQKKKPVLELGCFLWNSDSLEKINLPNLPNCCGPNYYGNFSYSKCILKAPPRTPNCLIVFLIENEPIVLFCRPGDKKWTQWQYARYEEEKLDNVFVDAITCDEKLYAFNSLIGYLCELVIGFGPQQLRFKRYNATLPLTSVLNKEQLVESCGELFMVRRKSIFEFEAYKMDFFQDKWERVLKLGLDRNFVFIGDYSASFCASEVGCSSANTIYFIDNNDYESFYSFNLTDESLSVWRNHPDSGNLWVLHDEMLSALRLPDKPRRREKIDEDQALHRSRECNSDDENKSESIWFQLPADMQKLIVQRLPTVFDHMNFRAVSKKSRSLVPPIQWKPNQGGVPFKYPWLMFSQGEKGMYSLYDPIAKLTHCINIPELEECEVRFSKQGWLLVTKAPTSIFFFEPFTRTRIQLPNLNESDWFEGICFSDSPTSSDWQIFGIGHVHQKSMKILYLRSSDEDWNLETIYSETLPHPSFTNPVFHRPYFCYLGKNGSLVFFKITEAGLYGHIESSPSRSLSSSSSRRFLVCYENQLISLFLAQMGRSIHVFKLDMRIRKWLEIENLEKEMLYLSQTTSLGVQAMDQNTRNTIQFSMFSDIYDDCSNISYCLKNRKYQTYRTGQVYSSLADLYDTKEFLHGTWIQPLVVPEMMTTDV